MELKLAFARPTASDTLLLIVPYGIETKLTNLPLTPLLLLIVPYGIETEIRA